MANFKSASNPSLKLMAARYGVIDNFDYAQGSRDLAFKQRTSAQSDPRITSDDALRARLRAGGGYLQQERMIKDKKRSLDKALFNSYQGADIRNVLSDPKSHPVRALINPDKTKQDYDDKILSVAYEAGFKPGDVFEWLGTRTKWLIYLQDLNELAYFRGEIRKCKFEIEWEDEEGKHSTYAAIRGPVETKIDYIQKHGISVDNPNYSLNILMPKNEETLKYFKRYSKFYVQQDEMRVCWRVEAADWISMEGILEINAVEYYANETEDDIEAGVVGAFVVKQESPNEESVEKIIKGETFIKPKVENKYTYVGELGANDAWKITKNCPVELKIIDRRTVSLKWDKSYSGQFDLSIGDCTKTIVVESLF